MMNILKGEKLASMLNRKDRFIDNYMIGQLIGSGTYGEVRVCKHILSQSSRAVRILYKNQMDTVTEKKFMTEVLLLIHLDHPSVMRFCEVFKDTQYYYVVSELCYGGDLLKEIESNWENDDLMTECDAAEITRQIVSAVSYMHSKNIIHMDLKPENILFKSGPELE